VRDERIWIHGGEFLRVRVPAYLERSLQLALAGVHAPFFEHRDAGALEVVLQGSEWERIAPRFAGATVTAGFRLVSVHPGPDSAFPARLRRALNEDGVEAALLPSFHHDHVLVRDDQLPRCLEVVRQLLSDSTAR